MSVLSPEFINFLISNSYRIVVFANICLLIGLIYTYKRNYNEFKSKYTLGLLFFASVFLLQNILLLSAHSIKGAILYSYIFLEFMALAILFKISI